MNENKRTRGRQPDKIAYTETIRTKNAIIRVNYPELSEEEKERRIKNLQRAAAKVIKAQIRRERERAKANQQ